MYLELADNGYSHLAQGPTDPKEYYVAVPKLDGGVVWVREDQLDNLNDYEFLSILEMQPYMNENAYLEDKAARLARREARRTKKEKKTSQKMRSREARVLRREAGDTPLDRLVKTGGDIAKNLVGGGDAPLAPQEKGFSVQAQAGTPGAGLLQSPVFLIGGTVVLLGLGYAIMSRQKKK